jgi:N utilization substance protein B
VVARIAPEWPVEQMAPVDRNVLRIALWEIGSGRAPVRVAINEAVELARLFSGEASRRMVNGALGTFVSSGTPVGFLSQ